MSLSEEEAELYYKLHWSLLLYVNQKLGLVKGLTSLDQVRKTPFDKLDKIREKLYGGTNYFDSFVTENPMSLPSRELEMVASWRNYVKKRFVVYRYLKNYTIFLDIDEPSKAYGVLALMTPLDEMFGPVLPLMADATLLPFNEKIIYDGIIAPYSIVFGGGIRRDFTDAYQEAKSRFGIILSLPFSVKSKEETGADKLRLYLRNERSRDEHREEIEELISKGDNLLTLYHQEMGKANAKFFGRRLRKIGLKGAWFALLEGTIIASGGSEDKLEDNIREILPQEKRRFVYIFHLK
jgi:hypothetical protein